MPKLPKKRFLKPHIKITGNDSYLPDKLNFVTEKSIAPDDESAFAEYKDKQAHVNLTEPITPCRYGKTKDIPFCDEIHEHLEFADTIPIPVTPIMDDAHFYRDENDTLADNELYGAFARFCEALGRVRNLIASEQDAEKTAVKLARQCCLGRLMIIDNQTGQILEPNLPYEVNVLQDCAIGISKPLYTPSGIEIDGENGKIYETRNHQTLCHYDASDNKFFCSEGHASTQVNESQIKPRRRKP